MKLYRWLVQQYPSSSFVKQANAKIESLAAVAVPSPLPPVPPAPIPNLPATATPVSLPAAVAPVVPSPGTARTLTSIQRVILPGSYVSPSNSTRKSPIAKNGCPVRRGCFSI